MRYIVIIENDHHVEGYRSYDKNGNIVVAGPTYINELTHFSLLEKHVDKNVYRSFNSKKLATSEMENWLAKNADKGFTASILTVDNPLDALDFFNYETIQYVKPHDFILAEILEECKNLDELAECVKKILKIQRTKTPMEDCCHLEHVVTNFPVFGRRPEWISGMDDVVSYNDQYALHSLGFLTHRSAIVFKSATNPDEKVLVR